MQPILPKRAYLTQNINAKLIFCAKYDALCAGLFSYFHFCSRRTKPNLFNGLGSADNADDFVSSLQQTFVVITIYQANNSDNAHQSVLDNKWSKRFVAADGCLFGGAADAAHGRVRLFATIMQSVAT